MGFFDDDNDDEDEYEIEQQRKNHLNDAIAYFKKKRKEKEADTDQDELVDEEKELLPEIHSPEWFLPPKESVAPGEEESIAVLTIDGCWVSVQTSDMEGEKVTFEIIKVDTNESITKSYGSPNKNPDGAHRGDHKAIGKWISLKEYPEKTKFKFIATNATYNLKVESPELEWTYQKTFYLSV